MDIEQLIERYFEGLTTSEDEATLRHFFMSDEVPEKMKMYKPLFVYFETEIKAVKPSTPRRKKSYVFWLSGVAACAAILIGSFIFNMQQTECPLDGNYVMIDGRCYTDETIIRFAMKNSLQSILDNEYTISDNKTTTITEMIESQLKDFDFLIDE